MHNSWRLKLGDRIFRPRRIRRYRLRRILGVPALFSAGYGNVGSSIYYALGIVALVANFDERGIELNSATQVRDIKLIRQGGVWRWKGKKGSRR